MNRVTKTVKEWFSNANEDLMAANTLYNLEPEKFLRSIPYHCQQAAEKSIKGYLAYKKIKFPKTHDIGQLATFVLTINPELSDLLKQARRLSIYAIEFRYPGATKREPTIKTSNDALKIAKRVFGTMSSLIPFNSSLDL